MDIGSHLAQLRTNRQISVYRLAQLSDVSINYIRRVEKGESIPSIEILTSLLTPLGVKLSEFFNEDSNVIYPSEYECRLIHLARQFSAEEAETVLHLAELLAGKK